MIIGIISDTHDNLAAIERAFAVFTAYHAQLLIHAGDWTTPPALTHIQAEATRRELPLKGVLGNNDQLLLPFQAATPAFQLAQGVLAFTADTLRLAVYHGHHKPTLARQLAAPGTDVFIRGHSHKPLVEELHGKLIINPGSTAFAIPRRKDFRPTVALLDTATRSAQIVPI